MKKIVNFRPLFYCFIALFGAILFAKYIFLSNWLIIALFIILIGTITTIGILRKAFKSTICILLFIVLGILSYAVEINAFSPKYFPEDTLVSGRVGSGSATYGNRQYIILEDVSVEGEEISQNVYLVVYGAPYLSAGDKVLLTATLTPISAFNEDMDVQASYYKNNCYYYSSNAQGIVVVGSEQSLSDQIQNAVKEKLLQNMTEDNANLAFAMLFGDQSDVDSQTKYDYRVSGIVHVLSVSGLHFGIVVGFLYWILRKLKAKNWLCVVIIVPVLIFYGYLCGFAPCVVRSIIMSSCLLIATTFGKRYDSLSAIGFAGLLILLFKPLYAFDVGFQLSFGCVIGIAIFYRSVYKVLKKRIGKFVLPDFLAKPLATTIAAQFLILPVLISIFDGVSFLSIFINIIVIPIFNFAFILTFISAPLIFVFGFMGNVLWFSSLLLEAIGDIANFVASQTWSIIPNFKLVFAAFVCFLALMFVSSRLVLVNKKTKLLASSGLTLATCLMFGLVSIV